MRQPILIFFLLVLGVSCQSTSTFPQHWPDRHGPFFNGIVPAMGKNAVPVKWDIESGQNITWKTKLEGYGHSTPIITGKFVWFTAATIEGKKQYVYCIDRDNGQILHHKLLFENKKTESLGNKVNTYATPTCAADEKNLYVHFGTYGTACLDLETAEVLWQRRDINVLHLRGPASSPLLYKDRLILTFDGTDRQYMAALDKKTGKTLWETDRSVDYKDLVDGKPKRDGDFRKAFSTPNIAYTVSGPQLVSVSSRAAYGYDPLTGKEIWILRHKNFNAAIRPLWLSKENLIILNTGSSKAQLLAVKADKKLIGDITDSHVVWSNKRSSRYCLPIYFKDHIYDVTHDGTVSCIHAVSGKRVWSKTLVNRFMASPLLLGDKIYCVDEFGKTLIFKASPEGYSQIIANDLDDEVSASPAVAEGALYIRSKKYLYKISAQ